MSKLLGFRKAWCKNKPFLQATYNDLHASVSELKLRVKKGKTGVVNQVMRVNLDDIFSFLLIIIYRHNFKLDNY